MQKMLTAKDRIHSWTTSFGALLLFLFAVPLARSGDDPRPPTRDQGSGVQEPEPAKYDSFRYYGPNGLYRSWTADQRLGRDTWIFWSGGNEKFLRFGTLLGGQQALPVSIEWLRLLDARKRDERFTLYGLINEPNFETSKEPDPETGLWLDVWKGDPYKRGDGKYTYADAAYPTGDYPYYPDPQVAANSLYGESTGIVGLRKFKNPNFDEAAKARWQGTKTDGKFDFKGMKEYFKKPSAVEPPYLVGFSCAFCHMSFNPNNPPSNPNKPRWDNLAANMGNQYFREGELFFGRGRVVFGDQNPGPNYEKDPYDTRGLTPKNLVYQYATTQQLGTSETSRISYDFINNPNTINSIFNLGNRPLFSERSPDGKLRLVNHVLKDGADSVGIQMALLRVWINIFCEGRYWADTLHNPANGHHQTPLDLTELRLPSLPDSDLSPAQRARVKELQAKYGPGIGQDWGIAHVRNPYLLSYLASYTPYHLEDSPGGQAILTQDAPLLDRGREVFADTCAECHSNKRPHYTVDVLGSPERKQFFRDSVKSADFRTGNTLSDDVRYSVADLGTNSARAMATNAIDGDVWAQLSSKDYKALPPLGRRKFIYKWVNGELQAKPAGEAASPDDLTIDFTAPGGGRGYYRTPSLVSMWATAPYLHNNSLGDYYVIDAAGNKKMFPNDGRELLEDGKMVTVDTSVEGRLKMFDDAATKLLWPEKRRYYIKKASETCTIVDLQPVVQGLLPGVLSKLLFEFVEEEASRRVDAYLKDKGISGAEADTLKRTILAATKAQLAELQKKFATSDLVELKKQLLDLVQNKLAEASAAAAGPSHADPLKKLFDELTAKLQAEIVRLESPDFLNVAKGTPINLYFNLGAAALPYALGAQAKYYADPKKLAETLLQLSECPDLIEDKGHTYGAELPEADKKALIAYLKTL